MGHLDVLLSTDKCSLEGRCSAFFSCQVRRMAFRGSVCRLAACLNLCHTRWSQVIVFNVLMVLGSLRRIEDGNAESGHEAGHDIVALGRDVHICLLVKTRRLQSAHSIEHLILMIEHMIGPEG